MSLDFGSSIRVGEPQAGFSALSKLEFFVLVGVTGVGKTTTLEALNSAGWQFSSLPDRRVVTDVIMIEPIAGKPVTDREERFALTAKYRELHPGGMAQAIWMLQLNLEQIKTPLVFDGLRGLEEVSFAAQTYTKSRFIVLDAPDETRVERLIGRSDAFDHVSSESTSGATLEQLQAIKGVKPVFSDQQLEKFAALEHHGLSAAEIVAKTKIVVTERRNYDPIEARDYLLQLDSKRVLYVDTTAAKPEIIAQRIMDWV
jgi:energy-coupling factor transporter ATP-binding protein EcfA2